MPATFYLIACALATAQTAPMKASDWQLQPHLVRGQELVYRGTFAEEDDGPGVRFRKALRLESRVFVLNIVDAKTAEVAFFTVCKGAVPAGEKIPATAVRLETAHVEGDGQVKSPTNTNLGAALDGPPTVEVGMFVHLPGGWTEMNGTWEVGEPGRPLRRWRVADTEAVAGIRCVRLVGTQHSDNWERPSGEENAWERVDTVWLDPQSGFARKVERVIERREGGRRQPNRRLVLKYELEKAVTFPSHLAEDRRREIQEALNLTNSVTALLPRAGQVGPRPFEAILSKVNFRIEHDPPTEYREAILQVQHLAEIGRRGESPPELPTGSQGPVAEVVTVGKVAPDFLAAPIGGGASARLKSFLGHPILLVFYDPTASSAEQVLRFAQKIRDLHRDEVTVVGMAVSENPKAVEQQRDDLRLSFPILSGTGLGLSYGVDATPKLLVLDAACVVQGSYVGWGPEIPQSVQTDLKRCLGVPR